MFIGDSLIHRNFSTKPQNGQRKPSNRTLPLRHSESVFGKDFPLACRRFLLHQRIPCFCLRIVCESVVKRAVRVLEDELDAVAGAFAVAQRFANSAAKDIDPMDDVSLAGVLITDVDHCFIIRCTVNAFHVQHQVLMIEHPLGLESIFGGLAFDLASEFPIPD